MAGPVLLLGILLLILIARTPKGKPFFSRITKLLIVLLGILCLVILGFFAMFAAWQIPYMIGQTIGALLILAIFVGIGFWIRQSRAVDVVVGLNLER